MSKNRKYYIDEHSSNIILLDECDEEITLEEYIKREIRKFLSMRKEVKK